MYIINTSFFVDPAVHGAWLGIVTDKYLPFLRSEGCGIVSFTRVISNEPIEHFTYSLITEAKDLQQYNRYMEELFAEYERLASMMFESRVTTFNTLMKRIEY